MPASFYNNNNNGQEPIGTPVGAATNGHENGDDIFYTRIAQVIQNDQEKTTLLHELFTRYQYLSQQVQTLSDERGSVRREALTWQYEKQSYEQQLRKWENEIERNPFVIVLIDGDGMIFQDEFIRDGEQGGRRAAAQLHAAVANHIERANLENRNIPLGSRIVCRIYANVKGLADVLVKAGVVEEVGLFEDFVRGFTRGKTLFDFVDVGPGKDRADEKVIETFKLYTHDVHCRRIFFGCSHDNGFARSLEEYMHDKSCLHKVTLLEGVPFEKELLALPYNTEKFPGIFRESKVSLHGVFNGGGVSLPVAKNYNMVAGLPSRFPPPPSRTPSGTGNLLLDSPVFAKAAANLPRTPSSSTLASDGMPAIKPTPGVMNWAAKAAAPAPPVSASPTYKPANRDEFISRNRIGQRIDPPCSTYDKSEVDRIKKIKMCNVHFLRNECPYGDKCTHLHNYRPTPSELNTLRLVARMAPCQNGSACQDIKCIYGHRCPAPAPKNNPPKAGKTCIFGESCKFPPELHDVDCNVVKTLVIR